MNIAQLLIAGAAQGKPTTQAPGAGLSESSADFESLLAGMLSGTDDTVRALMTDAGRSLLGMALVQRTPEGMMDREHILAALGEHSDILAALGEHRDVLAELGGELQALFSSLLTGDAAEPHIEPLKDALGVSIARLGHSEGQTKGAHAIFKALVGLHDAAQSGELAVRLEESVKTLPEALKLKLKLHVQEEGRGTSGGDGEMLHLKLLAHVMGGSLNQAKPSDDSTSTDATLAGMQGGARSQVRTAPAAAQLFARTPQAEVHGGEAADTATGAGRLGLDEQPQPRVTQPERAEGMPHNSEAGAEDLAVDDAAFEDILAAHTEAGKPAPAKPARLGNSVEADQGDGATAFADDAGGTDSAGFGGGRSEAGTDHDTHGDARVQTAGTSAEKSASASRKGFAEHMASQTESARGGVADPHGVTKQVADRFVEKFDMLVAGHKGEAKIQLQPKHLGEIKIHLLIENGSMKAALDASSHQVKEMLEANLQSLKQSLENQGIQISRFDVSVNQQQQRGYGFHQNRQNVPLGQEHGSVAQDVQHIRASIGIDGGLAVDVLA